ncbi:MAG: type VI secretion system baseplate subunit TssG [Pirellulaceae bacterium]|nr:type VI secretion system baseplate subunit TssG [Pirellulaceae bacterium]
MASEDRPETPAVAPVVEQLLEDLERDPYRFSFFQALRYLEAAYPDKPRVGCSLRPSDDPVRIGQEPSLAFAPSTLSAFRRDADGRPPRLEVNFLGMFGPNGPLPLHLTEYARQRLRTVHDPTFARFLDIFHHRMLGFFYRAWAAAEPVVQHDRPETDRFACYVGSLCGLGTPGLRRRDRMPDLVKLHFAGHLVCQTRYAQGLRDVVAEFFQVPGEIREFVGQWLELPNDYLLRLGESPSTGRLGISTTIGARVWDCQQKFRIVLGPIDFSQFQRLLPGGDSLKKLADIVRNYTGDQLGWDLQLILKKEEVPQLRLGYVGSLGWSSWLTSQTPTADVDDLILETSPLAK